MKKFDRNVQKYTVKHLLKNNINIFKLSFMSYSSSKDKKMTNQKPMRLENKETINQIYGMCKNFFSNAHAFELCL